MLARFRLRWQTESAPHEDDEPNLRWAVTTARLIVYLRPTSVVRGEKDALGSVLRAPIEPQPIQMDRNARSRLRARRMSRSSTLSSNPEGVTFRTKGVDPSAISSARLDPAQAIIIMAAQRARLTHSPHVTPWQ